jgi:hypothetical protein
MFIITGLACASVVNQVRVEPGDAPSKPVFVLTDTTGRGPVGTIYGFSVIPCGSETPVWQLVAGGSNGAPSRLVYGDTVPGYVTRIGQMPLKSGCYDVYMTDSRRVRFHVDGTGRVTAEARRDSARR